MKALTICQCYAHLIVTPPVELPPGVPPKRVENRRWPTQYRGPLLIHAGKSREWLVLSGDGAVDETYGIRLAAMSFGAVVGIADLTACLPLAAIRGGRLEARFEWLRTHAHTEGPCCFVLENVRRFLRPVPFRGGQGLFEVGDIHVADALAKAVAVAPGEGP